MWLCYGVWMGYDDNTPLRGVTGGGLPADIWRAAMEEIHLDLKPTPLPAVELKWRLGKNIENTLSEPSSLETILGKFFNNLFTSN